MHRRAETPSDHALDPAPAATRAGAFEGDILADMQGAVFEVMAIMKTMISSLGKIKELF